MSRPTFGTGPARFLLCLVVLAAAGLILFAGCTTSPGGGQGQPAVTATPVVPSYVVHVPGGSNRGLVLLVGRSDCPHCRNAKAILANLSVDYYWIDLLTLDQANTSEVLKAVSVCKDTRYVPMLIVNGEKCVVGDNEQQILEALK
jgi:glutaredoxin